MGQNWWWVALLVVVAVLLAVAALRARAPRGETAPRPDEEVPPAEAHVVEPAPEPPAEEPVTSEPQPDDPRSDEETPPPTHRVPEPADSALAALDSGLADEPASVGAALSAVSAVVMRPGQYEGSVLPAADGSAPSSDHPVKANEGSHRYHTPESPYYVRTRADVWFGTEAEAQAAGFTAWNAPRSS
ncbi:MAG: hypothetical protein ACRDQ0_05210 [Pseudonocardia sp.]